MEDDGRIRLRDQVDAVFGRGGIGIVEADMHLAGTLQVDGKRIVVHISLYHGTDGPFDIVFALALAGILDFGNRKG